MTIRRLKTLIAIAEKGTFARAADVIHVSQAAISQQMKSLEQDFRITLFDRSKRPPKLNQSGLALTAEAREIVHCYETMLQTLLDEGALSGQLMLGAVPTTLTGLVPRTVSALKTVYPDLHIRIVPGLSADLMPQVDRGYLDAAILSQPDRLPNHMNWRPFSEEPLVLLAPLQVPTDDPLELLATHPYIRFSRRAWVGRLIDQWLEERRIRVDESMELESLEVISSMVFYDLGVSIVPHRSVPSPHPLPLKRIPLEPMAKPRILGVVSRKDSTKFRLIDPLVKELTEIVEAAGQVSVIRTFETKDSEG